jgi:hypothetical protein
MAGQPFDPAMRRLAVAISAVTERPTSATPRPQEKPTGVR